MISVSGLLDLSLTDQAMDLVVRGAAPHAHLVLKLCVQDDAQVTWRSFARFKANGDGVIRLSEARPERGTYQNPHAMGLFWSMRPDQEPEPSFIKRNLAPLEYRLEVENEEGSLLLERTFVRALVSPDVGVEKLDVHHDSGLAGEFYFEKGQPLKNKPLVLIFGGSGGGLEFSRRAAALLASHGIPSLALAYFAYSGRPATLSRIEIEYFQKALHWLKERAGDSKSPVTVIGGSRGGELSLILGSLFPGEIDQVVARVPSHIVWAQGEPSWIYQGEPLSHVSMLSVREVHAEYESLRKKGEFIALTPLFQKVIAHQGQACQEAAIAVEKIRGKALLISGEDDQTWPSAWFSDQIVERMHAHGRGGDVCHLKYPDAGHAIPLPYYPSTVHDMVHPVDGGKYKNGGTDEGDARAAEDSWKHIIELIHSIGAGSL
jgi:hypothetical protein